MSEGECSNLSFEEIYEAYFAKMKRFSKEYVLSDEDAENIVHDVFLDLWEKWDTFSTKNNMFAFLFISVKHKCIDFLRHRAIMQKAETEIVEEYQMSLRLNYSALEAFSAHLSDPDDVERMVMKAINSLPEKCREIFIKNKLEGKKQKEIAAELNISINTIESQMAIAYKKLRMELKDALCLLLFLYFL